MGQKPLESWIVKRINQLFHDQHLSKALIAKRLGISRTAIRLNLKSENEWSQVKAQKLSQ